MVTSTSDSTFSLPAVLGALGGAALGAAIWALVSYLTDYEIGYLAWGVGLLTGALALQAGGRGPLMGVLCALLAVGGIFAGKLFATRFVVHREVERAVVEASTEELYHEILEDARLAAALDVSDHEAIREFMFARDYTLASSVTSIGVEEMASFRNEVHPGLLALHEEQPDYATWRERRMEEVRQRILDNIPSNVELMVSDLDAIDLVFVLLGILTAWRVVNPKPRPEA